MNQATSALTDEAVEALRQRLRGPLLFATEAGFEEATLLWNAMIDEEPQAETPLQDPWATVGSREAPPF